MGFDNICILVLWTKVASALEGLSRIEVSLKLKLADEILVKIIEK